MKKGLCCVIATLALACGSCGNSGIYPVSGKVTFQGTPASGATVFFSRQGGDAMSEHLIMGIVQGDGSFELVCGSLGKGAPPGEYNVLIEWRRTPNQARHGLHSAPGAKGRRPDRLKGRYADPKHSRLRAVVKAGVNELSPFALTD